MRGRSSDGRRVLFGLAAVLLSSLLLWGYTSVQAPWHWLGTVVLGPFLVALFRAERVREAASLGAAMAIGYTVAVGGWFADAVARYTGISPLLALSLLALSAVLLQPQLVVAPVLLQLVRGRGGSLVAQAATFCSAHLAVEWLWPKLLGDTLGYGLYPSTSLRQLAELGGVPLLTLVVLLANVAVAATVSNTLGAAREDRRRRLRECAPLAAVAVGALVAAGAFGHWRIQQLEAEATVAKTIRLGVVQANLTRYGELAERLGTYDAVRLILDTHYAMSERLLASGPLDAVIWPETVYPTTFGVPQSPEGAELDEEIEARVASWGVPLVFGAYDREGGAEFNAAMFVDPRRASGHSSYRKTHPFPLTEWVPGWLESASLRSAFPWMGTWQRGTGPKVIPLGALKVAPLICYDSLAPRHVTAAAELGAELLVTLANDSWFGGTRGTRLHLAVAAFRSVETRRPQVRATNSGISAAIDALGEIREQTKEDRAEVLSAELRLPPPRATAFMRLGNWIGWGAVGLLALIGVQRCRARVDR